MLQGVLTLGSMEVVPPFGLPGIGIFLIVDRTSVPESIERFNMRTTNATPARKTKTRRFPRSKSAIVLRIRDRDQVYIMR